MNRLPEPRRLAVAIGMALVSFASASGQNAPSLKVMISSGFKAAYQELVPDFERKTGLTLVPAYGASMRDAPDAIPNGLQRGESADVVIFATSDVEELGRIHNVIPGTRVDVPRSLTAT